MFVFRRFLAGKIVKIENSNFSKKILIVFFYPSEIHPTERPLAVAVPASSSQAGASEEDANPAAGVQPAPPLLAITYEKGNGEEESEAALIQKVKSKIPKSVFY